MVLQVCSSLSPFNVIHPLTTRLDFMGQFSIPVADIEGELIDSYFTLLPRDGKKDAVSGKIRIQAHVKVLFYVFMLYVNG